MPSKSADLNKSRYSQGGITYQRSDRADWWERFVFPAAYSDINFTVSIADAGRPDLIASRVYGNPALMWVVLQYNNIVDINEELVAGTVLSLPSPDRLQLDLLNSPTGGIRV